jgi:hypothetical protein
VVILKNANLRQNLSISQETSVKNLIKIFFVIILVGLKNQPFAAEGAPSKLESLGKRYIQFMSDVGSFVNGSAKLHH